MKYIYISLISIIFIGCQTYQPTYTFKSIGTQSNDPEDVQISQANAPISTKISFRGYKKTDNNALNHVIVRFDFQFSNNSSDSVTLKPSSYALLDDEARRFSPDLSYDAEASKYIILRPQSSTKITLHYPLPPGYDLGNVGSLRMTWNYQFQGHVYRRLTKFVKREVEYYYPYYNEPFFGYYRPWRFGAGFRYGRRFRGAGGFGRGGFCY